MNTYINPFHKGKKKCPKCRLPICDKPCSKAKIHVEDCPVLKDMFDDEDEDPNAIPRYIIDLNLPFSSFILISKIHFFTLFSKLVYQNTK